MLEGVHLYKMEIFDEISSSYERPILLRQLPSFGRSLLFLKPPPELRSLPSIRGQNGYSPRSGR